MPNKPWHQRLMRATNLPVGVAIGIGSLFAAWTIAAAKSVPAELAGTTWRWVHFASSTEDLAVPEPERYTVAFDASGWIRLRADCHHGAGGVTFPQPGAIHIDAIALTRALCPPGSLSGRFARDVARAIRWSLRDGDLNLELPVEAGTLQLARQP